MEWKQVRAEAPASASAASSPYRSWNEEVPLVAAFLDLRLTKLALVTQTLQVGPMLPWQAQNRRLALLEVPIHAEARIGLVSLGRPLADCIVVGCATMNTIASGDAKPLT